MCYNSSCIDGYSLLKDPNDNQMKCMKCYSSCKTCTALGTNVTHSCGSCATNFYPLEGKTSQCYNSSCIDGYIYNSYYLFYR